MYVIISQSMLSICLFYVIFTWIGGVKASRLLYSGSLERMNRKARKLLFWAWFPALLAAATTAGAVYLQRTMDAAFWQDRLYVEAPLVALPVILIWFIAVPKVIKLRSLLKKAMAEEQETLEPAIFGRAAQPGLIIPYQLAALGALTALYFALVPPVPFKWLDVAIPLGVLLLIAVVLWGRHQFRYQQTIGLKTYTVPNIWKRVSTMFGVLAVAAGLIILGINFALKASELPPQIDMASGAADYGGQTPSDANLHQHSGSTAAMAPGMVSVADLKGPQDGVADKHFTLVAQKKTVTLSSGKTVDAWTFNGQIPGPELRVREGDLVEVTLTNQDIEEGVTAHWHGLDVPNAEDGVAGATQNAVMPGETYTYRFRAEQVGTFWYHSHQDSQEAVSKGLFGTLIVEPKETPAQPVKDITVLTHLWKNTFAIGASDQLIHEKVEPGTPVRLRLINTDDWVDQTYTLVGTPFQVAAIDGTELNKPDLLTNTHVVVTTGGRYDLTFAMPDHPVYLAVGNNKKIGLLLSASDQAEVPAIPQTVAFDMLNYGRPATTPFDANSKFDREFNLVLDNKLGFYNRTFNFLYTLNGEVFPNAPMFMVKEGDLVKTTISNRGNVEHPMHLHGHHVLVLSHNGKPSAGSPWWSDTLDVLPGDTYEIAFVANNPGLWMDHCHNLTHAAAGMSMHLMYEGITTPYSVGSATSNHPE
ncbi:multicopper oxidase family protein [Paenibacillus whitsoniae]|nr:multicopper oxidase family protein [Paenibacillus whitsoniae]